MSDLNKIRPLVLEKLLLNETDDDHALSRDDIIELLKNEGIKVERKTLYKDIQQLRDNGLDVISEQRGKHIYYFVGQRDFELAEVKLLVDLVQASKFLTSKKSKNLIKKLETLTSKYEADELQRQVYVTDRIKTDNESIYYNVDKIHTAINNNLKVSFKYYKWGMNKQKVLRRDGKIYCVSPWALLWDNEKYYLVAYDDETDSIRHYRVDKIISLEITDELRSGNDVFSEFDMSSYTKRVFGMYDGETKLVKLQVANSLVGVMIDRFGLDIEIVPVNDDCFEIEIEVAVSNQFYGWIFALGNDVKIVSPEEVRLEMKKNLASISKAYKN